VSSKRSQWKPVTRYGKVRRKEKAMLARFDHRLMLTALLALSTTVLVVVVITLSTLLITLQPTASPQGDSGGGKPAASKVMDAGDAGWYGEVYGNIQPKAAQNGDAGAAEAPANMDAGGENYGWDLIQPRDQRPGVYDQAGERHAKQVSDYGN
jgi:hypothetical protein